MWPNNLFIVNVELLPFKYCILLDTEDTWCTLILEISGQPWLGNNYLSGGGGIMKIELLL